MTAPDDLDAVGIGLITTDYVYRVPEPPGFGRSVRASDGVRACGGPAATAMACLARLGASTRFIGKVGDDDEARFLRDELARQGVDVSRMRSAPGRTRTALVFVEESSGERGFLSRPEGHPPLEASDLTRADVTGARVVHLDDADEAGLQAARWARDAGATVVFDGTWLSDHLPAFLPFVDHAVVSEFFARRWLPDADDETILQRLVDLGAGTAVLTLGPRGWVALAEGDLHSGGAAPVDVVDTTGAGDAFHGGYIYGLLQGWDLPTRLRFAAATAALNCRALGGQAALPTRDEVESLLQKAWPTPT
jgi:ribokinase